MKKAYFTIGALVVFVFAIYTYVNRGNRGRNVEEYFGNWKSDMWDGDKLEIQRASNNLVLLKYISFSNGKIKPITKFCSYEKGCFYIGKSKTPIACEIDSFRIAMDGRIFWFQGVN